MRKVIAKARKWFTLNESPTFVPTENFIGTGIRAATRICIESKRLSETSCDPNHSSRPAIEIENPPKITMAASFHLAGLDGIVGTSPWIYTLASMVSLVGLRGAHVLALPPQPPVGFVNS